MYNKCAGSLMVFLFIFTRHVTYPHTTKTHILVFQKIQYGHNNMSKNLFYRPSALFVFLTYLLLNTGKHVVRQKDKVKEDVFLDTIQQTLTTYSDCPLVSLCHSLHYVHMGLPYQFGSFT